MTDNSIWDLYAETRAFELQNEAMKEELNQDRKSKEHLTMLGNMEAQGKMVNELKFKQERVEGLLEVTKEEEEKGKKELDDKVKVEKDLKF